MIVADNLRKTFRVHKREPGFGATVRSLFHRKFDEVVAVAGVSFTIEPGERVGFLGPNGAGKTTTLKLLSGLLHPSAGSTSIFGIDPRTRPTALLTQITLVMGQKQQLLWDLPPADTFEMNRAIYGVERSAYTALLTELTELLALGDVIHKPTRQLSLGERMKCELVAALLHRPKILFLDEPTIGLDVAMQSAVRDFVYDYNQRYEATVMLTSHYMADVAALCPRVIVIDKGMVVHDGDLRGLIKQIDSSKRVSFVTSTAHAATIGKLGEVLAHEGDRYTVRVPAAELSAVVGHLLAQLNVDDLAITDPPLEDVMRQVFGAKA